MSDRDPGLRTTRNATMLIGSFAIGQGSIFLAQTWLLATGNLLLLAQFASHFSFAILALFLVDAGSITVLARRAAATPAGDWTAVSSAYWATTVVRLGISTILIVTGAAIALTTDDGFSRSYLLFALPALLIWSFNFSGMLDGLQLSGLNGVSASAPYIASAAMLLACSTGFTDDPAAYLGGTLTIGYLTTPLVQITALVRLDAAPIFTRLRLEDVKGAARDGAAMLLGTLPGQVFFRLQIVLCALFFDAAIMALFLYARQLTAAASQIIGFLRRVEFPALVQALASRPQDYLGLTFAVQRVGTIAAIAASALLAIGGLLASVVLSENLAQAAQIVAVFSCGVLSGAVYLALAQGAYAMGRYGLVAVVVNLATVIGMGLSALLPARLGIAGFAVAEVTMHLAGSALLVTALVPRRHALVVR